MATRHRAGKYGIQTELVALVAASAALVLLLFSSLEYVSAHKDKLAEQRRFTRMLAEHCARLLAHPLWNLDRPAVAAIVASEMQSAGVRAIYVLEGEGGTVFYAAGEGHDLSEAVHSLRADTPAGGQEDIGIWSTLFLFSGETLVASRPLELGGERIGSVLVVVSLERMRTELIASLNVRLLHTIGTVVLLSCLILLVTRRVVVRPVQRLSGTMQRITENHTYSVRAEKERDDEIGQLVDSMNAMLARVEERDRLLGNRRRELEELVVERTAESEEARRRAEDASKAKSEFVANMSHELRTPMNAIIGMADIISRTGLTAKQVEYLKIIKASSRTLLGIINDILDISKIEANRLELESIPFTLRSVLEEVTDLFSNRVAEKGVELVVDVDADAPDSLIGDPLRLKQVLINLVTNAFKFTERGEVCLAVRPLLPGYPDFSHAPLPLAAATLDILPVAEPADVSVPVRPVSDSVTPQSLVSAVLPSPAVSPSVPLPPVPLRVPVAPAGVGPDGHGGVVLHISVSDTGIGIREDRIADLFGVFVQESGDIARKYGGTGLGLSIARELVHLMGGEITVHSVEGEGSVFSFSVPLQLAGEQAPERCVLPESVRKKPALLVEDSAGSRAVIEKMLTTMGMRCDVTGDGESAMALLTDRAAEYGLLLLDWRLPGMDGLQVVERLAERGVALPPVMLMTAFGREAEVQRAEELGIRAFLLKPVKMAALHRVILEAFGLAPVESGEKAADADRGGFSGVHALLVEDNLVNQQVAREVLESGGMSVTIAASGEEALETLRQASFDVIFMDVQLPGMDGVETTRRIRADVRFAHTPILAMTAYALHEDRDQALEAGMNDYVTKPIEREVLFRTLRKWLPEAGTAGGLAQSKAEEHARASAGEEKAGVATQLAGVAPATETCEDGMEAAFPTGLPGLDVAEGVNRVSGKEWLYRRILEGFLSAYGDIGKELAAHYHAGEALEVARKAHTVAGAAGNVSANGVRRCALRLEAAAKANSDLVLLLADMDEHLAEACASMRLLLEHCPAEEGPGTAN